MGDESILRVEHLPQHDISTGQGILRVVQGLLDIRCPRQPGEGGGFSQGQIAATLGIVLAGRGFHPIGADTQENLVQVELQNFVLGKFPFHLQGYDGLFNFPLNRTLCADREIFDVADYLLRDRAAATKVPRSQALYRRVDDGIGANAFVGKERMILRGTSWRSSIVNWPSNSPSLE